MGAAVTVGRPSEDFSGLAAGVMNPGGEGDAVADGAAGHDRVGRGEGERATRRERALGHLVRAVGIEVADEHLRTGAVVS